MKNWLFVGPPKAGQRTAIIYTTVQNYKTHGVDPQAYLQDILERLSHMKSHDPGIRSLQPKLWKQTQTSLCGGQITVYNASK